MSLIVTNGQKREGPAYITDTEWTSVTNKWTVGIKEKEMSKMRFWIEELVDQAAFKIEELVNQAAIFEVGKAGNNDNSYTSVLL